MSTLRNKASAIRFYDAVLNKRQLHVIDELVAENWVDHNPDPMTKPGREGLKAMFREMGEAFPDLTVTIHSMVAEGDRVGVAATMQGTHLGSYMGLAPTGRRVTCTGFDWLRIVDGKAVERWGVFDVVGLMKQLGAVPGPAPSDLKATSHRYYAAIDKHKGNLDAMRAEYFHPACLTHFAGQPQPLGVDALSALAKVFWGAFPDLSHQVTDQICEGDLVYNRVIAKGTHKGDFAGVKPTNKVCQVDVMSAQRYAEGKLVEQRIEVDMMSLLVQLGVISPPA